MTTIRTVIPYAPKEKSTDSEADIVDRAGSVIFEFVKHAGETTETELQEARDVAEKLADQLRATRDQIRACDWRQPRHWLRDFAAACSSRS